MGSRLAPGRVRGVADIYRRSLQRNPNHVFGARQLKQLLPELLEFGRLQIGTVLAAPTPDQEDLDIGPFEPDREAVKNDRRTLTMIASRYYYRCEHRCA